MSEKQFTRGKGLLEKFLSQKRSAMAERLFPERLRAGSLLDIGCGPGLGFLMSTRFGQKTGIDTAIADGIVERQGIRLHRWDIASVNTLPFPDASFDAIALLAVIEHLEQERLASLVGELYRILKPGGVLVATTPASWTAPLLRLLSRIGLVSRTEIDDHKKSYSARALRSLFQESPFKACPVTVGRFELGMNLWARIEKSSQTSTLIDI
jgi:SAM-dependent methyltransferase